MLQAVAIISPCLQATQSTTRLFISHTYCFQLKNPEGDKKSFQHQKRVFKPALTCKFGTVSVAQYFKHPAVPAP